ncbi:hypothetical protein M569_11068 [Genlisea aurea]|uniref:DNA-directed DNA polymerase n=1 Tax=Genlisea aurea TaxID=192259 RepID=S8CGK5_9LAMI|nr:hypothetical protein M569_11068 [Genlisea aurea]
MFAVGIYHDQEIFEAFGFGHFGKICLNNLAKTGALIFSLRKFLYGFHVLNPKWHPESFSLRQRLREKLDFCRVDDSDSDHSPVAGPSRNLNPKRPRKKTVAQPSHSPTPVESSSDESSRILPVKPGLFRPSEDHLFDQKTPLYEDNQIEVYAVKESFKRQKVFAVEDHLYTVKIKVKKGKPPLVSSILKGLEKSLQHMLRVLQDYYKKEPTRLVYMSIYQHSMTSAVLSNAIELNSNKAEDMSMWQATLEPNVVVIIKETERGIFKTTVLSENKLDLESVAPQDDFQVDYVPKGVVPPKFVTFSSYKPNSESIKHSRKNLDGRKNKNLMEKLILEITGPEYQGTTFLCLNASETSHSFLLKGFTALDLRPFIIQNGNKVNLISIDVLDLRFLNASSFFPGILEDIAKDFAPGEELHYFPESVNLHGVNNPNSGKSTNSSRSEMEFCYYKSFYEPEAQWQHLYNSPEGQDQRRRENLENNYKEFVSSFEVTYECEWKETKSKNEHLYDAFKVIYPELKVRPLSRLTPRTTVRGGLSEVYCLRRLWYSEKIASSGFPSEVQTESEKEAYCRDINDSLKLPEVFLLKPDNIVKNDARRQLAKSCLNNLYGKFSQQSSSTKREFVTSRLRMEEIFAQYRVINFSNVSDTMMAVEYETINSTQFSKSNLFVGAQINAYGREIIYEHMEAIEKAGGTVFSVDVDGLFYSLPNGVVNPLKFSNKDWGNEICHKGKRLKLELALQ